MPGLRIEEPSTFFGPTSPARFDMTTSLLTVSLLLFAPVVNAQQFGGQQVITAAADEAFCVFATDLDGDGDADVLSASQTDDKIAWYENLGGGTYGAQQVIATEGSLPLSVFATDLDGDGDADVLSASMYDDEISWYENLLDPDADQDGLSDIAEATLGTDPFDQDTDDDGLSDGEEFHALRPDTRWLAGPGGHYYRLAPAATWSQSSAAARAQGYELTSVQDEAEAIWLSDTFGDVVGGFWIGLNDFSGTFAWSDGSTSTYRRWATGEPNTSFVAAWVGGPSSAEPSYWYADFGGQAPRLAVRDGEPNCRWRSCPVLLPFPTFCSLAGAHFFYL
jgi:hypothetical protein